MVEKELIQNTTLAGVSILNGYPALFLIAVMIVGAGIIFYWVGKNLLFIIKDQMTDMNAKLTKHIEAEEENKQLMERRMLTVELILKHLSEKK